MKYACGEREGAAVAAPKKEGALPPQQAAPPEFERSKDATGRWW